MRLQIHDWEIRYIQGKATYQAYWSSGFMQLRAVVMGIWAPWNKLDRSSTAATIGLPDWALGTAVPWNKLLLPFLCWVWKVEGVTEEMNGKTVEEEEEYLSAAFLNSYHGWCLRWCLAVHVVPLPRPLLPGSKTSSSGSSQKSCPEKAPTCPEPLNCCLLHYAWPSNWKVTGDNISAIYFCWYFQ